MWTRDSIQARVSRGVKLLDKVQPDWRERIDSGKLDIRYADNCVLGQVYGSYESGLKFFGLKPLTPHNYGFNGHVGWIKTEEDVSDEYEALNAEWRSVLSGNKN